MGFFSKLITKGPGGPASVAKAMLKAYNTCRALNPGVSHDDIMRSALLSRYTTIRKMTTDEMEFCLEESKSIGNLTGLVIYAEIPMAFSRDFYADTLQELEKFYTKFAPEELQSIYEIPTNIKNFIEHREGNTINNNHIESFILAIAYGETRAAIKYAKLITKNKYSKEWISAQIEKLMACLCDGDTILPAKIIQSMFLPPDSSTRDQAKISEMIDALLEGDEDTARTCLTMLLKIQGESP